MLSTPVRRGTRAWLSGVELEEEHRDAGPQRIGAFAQGIGRLSHDRGCDFSSGEGPFVGAKRATDERTGIGNAGHAAWGRQGSLVPRLQRCPRSPGLSVVARRPSAAGQRAGRA